MSQCHIKWLAQIITGLGNVRQEIPQYTLQDLGKARKGRVKVRDLNMCTCILYCSDQGFLIISQFTAMWPSKQNGKITYTYIHTYIKFSTKLINICTVINLFWNIIGRINSKENFLNLYLPKYRVLILITILWNFTD